MLNEIHTSSSKSKKSLQYMGCPINFLKTVRLNGQFIGIRSKNAFATSLPRNL